jgi:hypothetical protein
MPSPPRHAYTRGLLAEAPPVASPLALVGDPGLKRGEGTGRRVLAGEAPEALVLSELLSGVATWALASAWASASKNSFRQGEVAQLRQLVGSGRAATGFCCLTYISGC